MSPLRLEMGAEGQCEVDVSRGRRWDGAGRTEHFRDRNTDTESTAHGCSGIWMLTME